MELAQHWFMAYIFKPRPNFLKPVVSRTPFFFKFLDRTPSICQSNSIKLWYFTGYSSTPLMCYLVFLKTVDMLPDTDCLLTHWGWHKWTPFCRRHFQIQIFLNKNVWISLQISLKFLAKVWINNIPVLVQVMAWRRPGDKPLSEPMMVSLLMHICLPPTQWVHILPGALAKAAKYQFFLGFCETHLKIRKQI